MLLVLLFGALLHMPWMTRIPKQWRLASMVSVLRGCCILWGCGWIIGCFWMFFYGDTVQFLSSLFIALVLIALVC